MPDPNNPDDNQIPQTFPEDTSIPPIPSGMVQDTSFPNPVQTITDAPPQEVNVPPGLPPIIPSGKPNLPAGKAGKKFGGRKMIATILGVFVLIGGITAGVILVKQQQDIREKAGFEKSTPIPTHSCPKPNLPPGGLAGLCPGEGCKTITDINSAGCVSGWRCDCPHDPYERTPTPGINAACTAVKTYDTNWNLLTSVQLPALTAGTTVRFAVSGTPADQIDKARFTINGVLGPETTSKKPGTSEYYDEYTIPAGTTSFTVTTQIHHLTLGWF